MRYQGKTVVITLGGSPIGRTIACKYARRGANVVVIDDNEHTGRETVDLIYDQGLHGIFFQGDMSVTKDVERIMQSIIHCYGRIDVLVNCVDLEKCSDLVQSYSTQMAGEQELYLSGELSYGIYEQMACDLMLQPVNIATKYMEVTGSGHIINLFSGHLEADPDDKAIIQQLLDVLVNRTYEMAASIEYVSIHCVSYGKLRTKTYRRLKTFQNEGSLGTNTLEEVANRTIALTGRWGDYVNGSYLMLNHELVYKYVCTE